MERNNSWFSAVGLGIKDSGLHKGLSQNGHIVISIKDLTKAFDATFFL